MNLSICTISFRHQLVSIEQLAQWAQNNHFQGIELWGIHAKNLADQPHFGQQWLAEYGLRCTMLSDYLPLQASDLELASAVQELSHLAKHWGAMKIRTFAGNKGSANTSVDEFQQLVYKLQQVCDWIAEHRLTLIIETHPNTYADAVNSTEQLINAVNRDNIKLNFDVLHVWESKAEVIPALEQLKPYIDHFHLKNISSEEFLDVFAPSTVYAAAGSREGMVPIFEGAVNYKDFFQYINEHPDPALQNTDASLEWFGNQCKGTLKRDRYLIQQLQQQQSGPFAC